MCLAADWGGKNTFNLSNRQNRWKGADGRFSLVISTAMIVKFKSLGMMTTIQIRKLLTSQQRFKILCSISNK